VSFSVGSLFYNPSSRIIRDLGVLALAVLGRERAQEGGAPLRVLDAMAGSGVRSLRYATEVSNVGLVHANELMKGDHPLSANLAPLISKGVVQLTAEDAIDMYFRARLSGERYDFVDCDAFGTGQPHTAEAWWAVATGGLLYLCATDSRCTAGHNAHKVMSGYAAVAKYHPSCNEQGLRLLLGAAWREAAQRNLHARPIFSYFDRPSSSFRVMLQLTKPKRPPADAYESLSHVARCRACGQLWKVPSVALGDAAGVLRPKYSAVLRRICLIAC
jgi:tRNA (guanine26-N2/guanine27-N2)-dimethyltransferase